VLPVFGPGTVRDNLGKGVNTRVSPISWLAEQEGAEFSILYGIDARASVLAADAFLVGAEDEYLLVRDAYLQRRRCQIVDCTEDVPDYLLPDYEFEVPDLDTLRR
jgi:phospholipid-binding lipoprotein MlaA